MLPGYAGGMVTGLGPGMGPHGAMAPLPMELPPHEEAPHDLLDTRRRHGGMPEPERERQRDYDDEQLRSRRRGKWDEMSANGAAALLPVAAPLPASAYALPAPHGCAMLESAPPVGASMAARPAMPQHAQPLASPAGMGPYGYGAPAPPHGPLGPLAPPLPPRPVQQQASKKQREIYVGNLLQHVVSAQMLKDFFSQILQSLPGFDPSAGVPVVNVQMSGEGKFAFVELRDETLAATMLKLDKVELCGRLLNVGRPSGYLPSGAPVIPLDTSRLRLPGINAQPSSAVGYVTAQLPKPPAVAPPAVAPPPANRKQRELYVGNLAVGLVTAQMLRDLFTLPLQSMPGFDPSKGAAVVNVDMARDGKFAFVELRDEALAATAISLFHEMDLCGRKLHIGRPRGYVDPATGAAAAAGFAAAHYTPLVAGGGAAVGAAYYPPTAQPSHAALAHMCAPPPQPAYAPAPLHAAVGAGGGYMMHQPSTHYPPSSSMMHPAALQQQPLTAAPLAMAHGAYDSGALGTPFLCLDNLVSAEALRDEREYAEIVRDIQTECQKCGPVLEIRVPRPGRPELAPYIGRAFVRFADIGAARGACAALNGRAFDGNIVRATFVTAQAYNVVGMC
ncbi:hypothetical protein KFE25_006667 [Diacronema lutheri]|uniref:RRM domain-containing protein n=2 Tax=Diacronema lutheri TaxID=2081491 RepID=A0A8J6CF44_DIALT|nr:hypothetical protein KFE25_006667 [Diacronema lutheri]